VSVTEGEINSSQFNQPRDVQGLVTRGIETDHNS